MDDEGRPDLDTGTAEPPVFGEARDSVLTPEGEIQSIGDFARGLGARRARFGVFAVGGIVLLLAVLNALQ